MVRVASCMSVSSTVPWLMEYPSCSFVIRLPSPSLHDTATAVPTSLMLQVKVWATAEVASSMLTGLIPEIVQLFMSRNYHHANDYDDFLSVIIYT